MLNLSRADLPVMDGESWPEDLIRQKYGDPSDKPVLVLSVALDDLARDEKWDATTERWKRIEQEREARLRRRYGRTLRYEPPAARGTHSKWVEAGHVEEKLRPGEAGPLREWDVNGLPLDREVKGSPRAASVAFFNGASNSVPKSWGPTFDGARMREQGAERVTMRGKAPQYVVPTTSEQIAINARSDRAATRLAKSAVRLLKRAGLPSEIARLAMEVKARAATAADLVGARRLEASAAKRAERVASLAPQYVREAQRRADVMAQLAKALPPVAATTRAPDLFAKSIDKGRSVRALVTDNDIVRARGKRAAALPVDAPRTSEAAYVAPPRVIHMFG